MTHPSDDVLLRHACGELAGTEAAAIADHLANCDTCTRTVRDLSEMDQVLRGLAPTPFPHDFAARVRARVVATPPPRQWWRPAAAAAVLLLGGLGAGYQLARVTAPAPPPAIVRNAEGPKFALIFAEDPSTLNAPLEERRRRYDEFMAWLRGIGDPSAHLGGSQLDIERGRIVGASTRAFDPELALSGFIVIRAANYDEAMAHASRCPLLNRGGQVIVRRLR